eukprot:EG_transcript_358
MADASPVLGDGPSVASLPPASPLLPCQPPAPGVDFTQPIPTMSAAASMQALHLQQQQQQQRQHLQQQLQLQMFMQQQQQQQPPPPPHPLGGFQPGPVPPLGPGQPLMAQSPQMLQLLQQRHAAVDGRWLQQQQQQAAAAAAMFRQQCGQVAVSPQSSMARTNSYMDDGSDGEEERRGARKGKAKKRRKDSDEDCSDEEFSLGGKKKGGRRKAGEDSEKRVSSRQPGRQAMWSNLLDDEEDEAPPAEVPVLGAVPEEPVIEKLLDHRTERRRLPVTIYVYDDGTEDIVEGAWADGPEDGSRPTSSPAANGLPAGPFAASSSSSTGTLPVPSPSPTSLAVKTESGDDPAKLVVRSPQPLTPSGGHLSPPASADPGTDDGPVRLGSRPEGNAAAPKLVEVRHSEQEVEVREYLVKWKGYSHLHNTWEAEEDMRGVRGHKKLTNYIKRLREKETWVRMMSPEEREQLTIEKEMEQTLVSQWTQVDRILQRRVVFSREDAGACRLQQEMERRAALLQTLQTRLAELERAQPLQRAALQQEHQRQLAVLQQQRQQQAQQLHQQMQQQRAAVEAQQAQVSQEQYQAQLINLNALHVGLQQQQQQQAQGQAQMLVAQQQAQLAKHQEQYGAQHRKMQQQLAEVQREYETQAVAGLAAGKVEYLVKWRGLPYCECTWEAEEALAGFQDEVQAFQQREAKMGYLPNLSRPREPSEFEEIKVQPSYMVGGELRDYQKLGITWLLHAWANNINGILADEMGLGKTIQTACFINYLVHAKQMPGPYLIVVPLSTLEQWMRELKKWAPQLYVVGYIGDAESRRVIRECDFYWYPPARTDQKKKRQRRYRFNVLLTTYELVLKDAPDLRRVAWCCLMVDEAQHLKNGDTKLYSALSEFDCNNFRLLITGTPLQNSLKELWCLLHFLMPAKFPSAEEFERKYAITTHTDQDDGGANQSRITQLHRELQPHILRRVKKDVEKSLPRKIERILRVELSPLQRRYCRWIITRNFAELNKGANGNQASLLNIVVELKKVANHPYLFDGCEGFFLSNVKFSPLQALIMASGKMVLLDKLLPRLRETGHRVLIFSQMVRVLDILADYLRLKGYTFQRLDGGTSRLSRTAAVEHFNEPGSTDFCFILSTRAGGLGLNLTGADTVILFDSDWNPQNDLQAEARAHRIGQTKCVNIYRLVTKDSIEESILERSKRKMVLSHLVIQGMDTSGRSFFRQATDSASKLGRDELQEILKFGAKNLFQDTAGHGGHSGDDFENLEDEALAYVDIDDVLSRAETREDEPAACGAAEEFLSSFNVSNFDTFQKSVVRGRKKKPKSEEGDPFWSELISETVIRRTQTAVSGVQEKRPRADGPSPPMRAARRELDAKDWAVLQAHLKAWPDLDNLALSIPHMRLLHGLEPQAVLDAAASLLQQCCDAAGGEEDGKQYVTVRGVKVDASAIVQRAREVGGFARLWGAQRAAWAGPPDRFVVKLAGIRPCAGKNWPSGWTVADDAMLLTGIMRHGYGSWEAIRRDPHFGLYNKVCPVAQQQMVSQLSMNYRQLARRTDLLLAYVAEAHRR